MQYDDFLAYIGDNSPYQIFITFLVGILNASVGVEQSAVNFLSPHHDHWCYVRDLENMTYEEQKQIAIPWDDWEDEYDGCTVYDYGPAGWPSLNESATANRTVQQCTTGQFWDTSMFTTTATSEWSLVCGKSWILEIISPVYMVGLLIGSVLAGSVADRFGRKKCLMIFTVCHVLSGMATAFSPCEWMYIFSRVAIAVSIRGMGLSGAILLMELISPRYRVVASLMYQVGYAFSQFLLVTIAFFIRDFRTLQLAVAVPWIIILTYWWLVPESPRWLSTSGRHKEAVEELIKIGRRSGAILPEDLLKEHAQLKEKQKAERDARRSQSEERRRAESIEKGVSDGVEQPASRQMEADTSDGEKLTYMDLLRHNPIRRYTISATMAWITGMMVYMGMSMNLDQLFGSIYMNLALAVATELPVYLALIYFVQYHGRKPIFLGAFIVVAICSAASIAFIYVPGAGMVVTVLSLMARSFCGCGTATCLIYIGELFPTLLRQRALGFANAVAAIVGIASPTVSSTLRLLWEPLPYIIYTALATTTVLVSLKMPETMGRPLPDTIDDVVVGPLDTSSESVGLPMRKISTSKVGEEDAHSLQDGRSGRFSVTSADLSYLPDPTGGTSATFLAGLAGPLYTAGDTLRTQL